MNYRADRYGNQLSILSFGCMRFPSKAGRIDIEETEREILTAIEGGVNYFDTAYIYPGSEAALGEILERNHLRDWVYIATKLPHYLIKSRDTMEKLFAEELRRLRTDHVDYYLMHMLTDTDTCCILGFRFPTTINIIKSEMSDCCFPHFFGIFARFESSQLF